MAAPRLGLVQPERCKGDEVDRDEGGGDVGAGEDVGYVRHSGCALRHRSLRKLRLQPFKEHELFVAAGAPHLR